MSIGNRNFETRTSGQALYKNAVSILVADKDPEYRALVTLALSKSGFGDQAVFLNDGEQVMNYLRGEREFSDGSDRPRPNLILLGLNMPRKDGSQTVDEIKSDSNFRSIPVVVIASSGTPKDVSLVYELGGNSFILKPPKIEDLTRLMQTLTNYWFRIVSLPSVNAIGD